MNRTSAVNDHEAIKNLIATRCLVCQRCWYPSRARCPNCLSTELQDYEIGREGIVYASTCVRIGSGTEFEPYVLAYVDFPDGLRVLFRRDPSELSDPFIPGDVVDRTAEGRVSLKVLQSVRTGE